MANRKIFIHGTVVEVCFRTEEGLPLPATPYIKVILESIFARAQSLFPVTICHYLVMANHIHMLVVVDDPAGVPAFVGYLKGESAHAVNRLMGRKKHTVWCDGFDSPIILDAENAIKAIAYIYSNPQQANLEDRIEKYPHLSTWKAFLSGGEERTVLRIPRDAVPALPRRMLSFKEQHELARKLQEQGREESVLLIEPDAWMACFDELAHREPEEVNRVIIERVRSREEALDRLRKKPVLGAHALMLETVYREYQPVKRGRRMLCLSTFKTLRVAFIRWFREHCAQAVCLRQAVDWLHRLPPGLFAPGGALRANLLAQFVPTANTVLLYE